MEENKNEVVTEVVSVNQEVQSSNVPQEAQVSPQVTQNQPVTNVDGIVVPTVQQVDVLANKKKKKPLVFLVALVGIAVVVILAIVLLQPKGIVGGNNNTNEPLKISTGKEWADKYIMFIQTQYPELTEFNVSFVDFNNDDIPELLFKYKDSLNKDTLRLLYIYEDDVLQTKYFHNYYTYLLFDLKTKEADWYLFINSNKNYGAYTSMEKLVTEVAFDSDIKTNTDEEIASFKRRYVDVKYDLVFYKIQISSLEDNYKTILGRYDTYKNEMNDAITKVSDKYSDYIYTDPLEKEEVVEQLKVAGAFYSYGNYFYEDVLEDGTTITRVISLLNNGTIIIEGISYKYNINSKKSSLEFIPLEINRDGAVKLEVSDRISYEGNRYYFKK